VKGGITLNAAFQTSFITQILRLYLFSAAPPIVTPRFKAKGWRFTVTI